MKPDYVWFGKIEEDHDGIPIMRHDASERWDFHNLKLTFDGNTGKLKDAEVIEADKPANPYSKGWSSLNSKKMYAQYDKDTSDTPRTAAEEWEEWPQQWIVRADLARELETELIAVKKELEHEENAANHYLSRAEKAEAEVAALKGGSK
jgi:hypothetical protein